MKYVKTLRFVSVSYEWREIRQGARSTGGQNDRPVPMMANEAKAFRDMVKYKLKRMVEPSAIYTLE